MANADMTPKQLIEEFIPKKLAELGDVTFPDLGVQFEVTIEGDGGGVWTIKTEGGKPRISAGGAKDPLVTVKTNRQAYDMGMKRAGGELDRDISGQVGNMLKMVPDQTKVDMIRQQLSGTMMIKIATDEGDALIGIGFVGPADLVNPRCTIETSEAELNEMRETRMPPQQAFMAGKIRLGGDMSLAMTAGMLLAPM
ncbi:MAG: SCP2 sterol-binding domain-containing protein [Deltaproteobacteria bacterium]|nr:SCP2 sterol-binding domain-containing protein [Deltaproteobacteria bacterium]